jgi:fucose 4-O-acetylase-like acetyltransferase
MMKEAGLSKEDDIQSRVITWLRFALMAGVVLLHTHLGHFDKTGSMFFNKTCEVITKVLMQPTVPAFFFISGYLFFYKVGEFRKNVYFRKVKSRVRSLLIPYLFWICAWLIFYYVLYGFPPVTRLFNLGKGDEYSLGYVVRAFAGFYPTEECVYPRVGQFWFIRDLFFGVLLSPLIYLGIRYMGRLFIVFFFVLWLFNLNIPWIGLRGLNSIMLFSFSFGAYFSLRKNLLTEQMWMSRKVCFVLYPLLAVLDMAARTAREGRGGVREIWDFPIHRFGMFIGAVCFINIGYYLVKSNKVRPSAFLASASFFLFALHMEWLQLAAKVILNRINPSGDGQLFLCFFGRFAFYIIASLAVFAILSKLFPRFTAIITGGR